MGGWKSLAKRILGRTNPVDYREVLFQELCGYLKVKPQRILEIGPKDGKDTRRLLQQEPETLTVIDLPRMKELNEVWLREINSPRIQYISANFMYSEIVGALDQYDCIWCTGVLYHNPEQLRMVRMLYDLLKRGGVLVLESATVRRRLLRDANCVEIFYPPSEVVKKKYHLSQNITHLPSAKAMASWMGMVGFGSIIRSECHRKVSVALARTRAAYLGTKPLDPQAGLYYNFWDKAGFEIGKAL